MVSTTIWPATVWPSVVAPSPSSTIVAPSPSTSRAAAAAILVQSPTTRWASSALPISTLLLLLLLVLESHHNILSIDVPPLDAYRQKCIFVLDFFQFKKKRNKEHSSRNQNEDSPVKLLLARFGSFCVYESYESVTFGLSVRLFLEELEAFERPALATRAFYFGVRRPPLQVTHVDCNACARVARARSLKQKKKKEGKHFDQQQETEIEIEKEDI